MADNERTPAEVRREINAERERLVGALEHLRREIGEVTSIADKVRANLPVVAAGALGAGFLLAGGVGATMRLLARRSREGREKVRLGPFSFVDRR